MSFPDGYCRPASQLINSVVSPYGSLVDPARAILVTLGTAANPVTTGTEFAFPKLRRRTPYAFQPLHATTTAGVALSFADVAPINLTRTDGQLGVTMSLFTAGGVGDIGERYSLSRLRSAQVQVTTTNVAQNVCAAGSVSIPSGEWNCQAMVGFSPNTTTVLYDMQIAVSKTSAGMPSADTIAVPAAGEARARLYSGGAFSITTAGEWVVNIPSYKATFTVATPLYLVTQNQFTTSTNFVYGSMEATRISLVNNGVTGIVTGILWCG